MSKIPKKLSEGEETFALHCKAEGFTSYREYVFAPPRKWRFDFAFIDSCGGTRVAVEIEGGTWCQGRHNRGAGYEADIEKYNMAACMGWRVLRYTTKMVTAGTAIRQVKKALS